MAGVYGFNIRWVEDGGSDFFAYSISSWNRSSTWSYNVRTSVEYLLRRLPTVHNKTHGAITVIHLESKLFSYGLLFPYA